MMYYDPNMQLNSWLTEHCLICGSINHIFVDRMDAHAWECYFCLNKFWLDEMGKDQYILQEGVNENEAEAHLRQGHYNIIYLLGNYERDDLDG